MINISDIEDSRIVAYKNLKYGNKFNDKNDYFIADNIKVVVKLFDSKIEIESIFATNDFYSQYNDKISLLNIPETQIFVADKSIMNQIIGYNLHNGVMALAKTPEYTPLTELDNTLVIMNDIVKSDNVGAIIRNANAFNIRSIIFDNATSNPYLRKSVRVSMGSIFDMKIFKSDDLSDTIIKLKQSNFQIIASEINNLAIPIFQFKPKEKTAIIFGNESKGINQSILDQCDDIFYIPVSKDTNSINVAASSAIFFFNLHNISNFNK